MAVTKINRYPNGITIQGLSGYAETPQVLKSQLVHIAKKGAGIVTQQGAAVRVMPVREWKIIKHLFIEIDPDVFELKNY